MNFSEWEPVYEAILADFGFPRADDRAARDLLADLTDDFPLYDVDDTAFEGKTVAVAGGAETITADHSFVENADVTVATSIAADRLRDAGFDVDWLVTDLDGNPKSTRNLSHEGIPIVVHAHGDNRDALRKHVPDLAGEFVVPTTQAEPVRRVRNFGGFTDGDRAAFLADALGASRLTFPGWDFDDPSVTEEKRRKLAWAERLLCWLETRRGERFEVLDGRRGDVDPGPLPI